MPIIQILEDCKLAIDGLHVKDFKAGEQITVSGADAESFIKNGFAEEANGEKAQEEAPANKAEGKAPANKAKK